MLRTVIEIDENACNGCGLCVSTCHEGALEIIDGVAKLVRDDFCDGMGDCLPACPQNAISFVQREVAAYDAAAVEARKRQHGEKEAPAGSFASAPAASELANWPVQIKLAPLTAPYFQGADLLVAADCCAFAHGAFHRDYMRGKVTLIGCPKLDGVDYTEKLSAILAANDIASVTVTRMEVPCCGGIERAVIQAREASGKDIPLSVVTLSAGGEVLEERLA